MRNPNFREVFESWELAESISSAYGFSTEFQIHLARFLDQAPTTCGGRCRALDDYVDLLCKRLGWSRPHALMFVAGEWPASLLAPDFEQEVMKLKGVA